MNLPRRRSLVSLGRAVSVQRKEQKLDGRRGDQG